MTSQRRADMFTPNGRPSVDDPREHGPRLGDEAWRAEVDFAVQ